MSRRLNKECKRRRTVRMEREDLEATYNRVHYDSCEISTVSCRVFYHSCARLTPSYLINRQKTFNGARGR